MGFRKDMAGVGSFAALALYHKDLRRIEAGPCHVRGGRLLTIVDSSEFRGPSARHGTGGTSMSSLIFHQLRNDLDRNRGRTNLEAEAIVEDDNVSVDFPNTVTFCGEQT